MRNLLLRLSVLGLLLVAHPLAAIAPSGDGWGRVDSENFELFSDLPEPTALGLVGNLEDLRAALAQIFPDADLTSPVPTLMYAFANRESFGPYALDGGPDFFAPHIHANFAAVMVSEATSANPIVYRQYIHEVVNDNVPQIPVWLRHGLAEVFSTFESDGSSATVGLPIDDQVGLLESSPLGLEAVMAMTAYPVDPLTAQPFVAEAWALAHYLLSDVDRRKILINWGRSVADGEQPGSLVDALGTDLATLETAVDTYAQADLPRGSLDVESSAAGSASWMSMQPNETLFHLGDLLIHTQPDAANESADHFRKALELQPEYAPAMAGLGYVQELTGDLEGACVEYGRALEQLPDAFRLQFLLGECELKLLGKQRPQTPEQEARLERALAAFGRSSELQPEFGEAWARLGYAYNLQARPSAEAIPALERSYELLPDRSDVAYNLLLGYARSGKRDEATQLVEGLPARGADEETLARCREVLYQLDYQAAIGAIRDKQFDEAIELLERVKESSNPQMRQQALDRLEQIQQAQGS